MFIYKLENPCAEINEDAQNLAPPQALFLERVKPI
jgi:hypothetical protein